MSVVNLGKLTSITVKNRRIQFNKTRAAINRPPLRRVEGNCGLCLTAGAVYGDLYPLLDAGGLGRGNCRKSFVFRVLTFLAAFWRVLQLLVAKEGLFAGGPDKVFAAVNA